jgi:hypothetical protein
MDPITQYVQRQQRELRLEAEEQRRAKQVKSSHHLQVRARLGRLFITMGEALNGVPELPPGAHDESVAARA